MRTKFLATVLAVLITSTSLTDSNANILANKVEPKPNYSKVIEIYLIDLSRSVEKQTVIEGLQSIREKIAGVYGNSGASYSGAASSYYYWVPVRGVNDRKDFYSLFDSSIDGSLWSSVRNTVGGRTNQIKVLEKLRSQGGLWRDLIMEPSLVGCTQKVMRRIAAPGLFGNSLSKVASEFCTQAIVSRNNYAKMQTGVAKYLSGKVNNNGGSDIFGAIARIDDEAQSKSGLAKYSKVNLVFVTDGIHNTSVTNLKSVLLNDPSNACQFGRNYARGLQYDSNKFTVRMFGLGEGRSEDSAKTELLRGPLKEFWNCYWKKKGISNPEFNQLSQLGIG